MAAFSEPGPGRPLAGTARSLVKFGCLQHPLFALVSPHDPARESGGAAMSAAAQMI